MGSDPKNHLTELQEHLRVYSKGVADAIWELQQLRDANNAKVDEIANGLLALADKLDGPGGLIDSLPTYPRDELAVKSRLEELGKQHEAMVPRLQQVLVAVEEDQRTLRVEVEQSISHILISETGSR